MSGSCKGCSVSAQRWGYNPFVSITVEARYQGQQLILDAPLNLPEGQRVRVTIETMETPTIGQRIMAQWRESGVIGAWASRKTQTPSSRWARELRVKASRRKR